MTPRRLLGRGLLGLALAGVAAVGLGYVHAGAMLTWAPEGARTADPEALSVAQRAGVLLTGVRIPRPRSTRDPAALGLAFEDRRIEAPGQPTLALWWVPRPGGEAAGAVLLVHGYAGARDQLLDLVPRVHALGWDAALVDLRGSGDSAGHDTTLGLDEAEDVDLVARTLTREGHAVVVYGFSMGAAAGLRALGELRTPARGLVVEAVFDRLHTTIGNRFAAMGLPRRPGADLLLLGGALRVGPRAFHHDPVRYAAGVHAPTLVLHGGLDTRARPAGAHAVQQALAGPSRWHRYDDLGHASSALTHPKEWSEDMAWLLELATR